MENHFELVQMLLNNQHIRNAVKDQKDIFGNNALHLAASIGSLDIISLLLSYEFSKEMRNFVEYLCKKLI